MNTIDSQYLIDNLRASKGQFKRIAYSRYCNMRKEFSHLRIVKETQMNCRTGINYDNLAIVKEMRSNGLLPASNQGLNGKTWIEFPFLLMGKECQQLRIYPDVNQDRKVVFYLDNKEISIDKISHMILASDMPKDCNFIQDIPLSYITDISF